MSQCIREDLFKRDIKRDIKISSYLTIYYMNLFYTP